MKLFRWAAAGASVYLIYKYSTGKKAKGEDIIISPPGDQEGSAKGGAAKQKGSPAGQKTKKTGATKSGRKSPKAT